MAIHLLNRKVNLDKGGLLLSLPFADTYDLEQLELASGSWGIENGALVGRFRGNGGDILIDFYGTMLSPCNNDLNFVLKAEGWDYERNDAARGFIGGLNGWYEKKAGFEKYPRCDAQALVPCDAVSGCVGCFQIHPRLSGTYGWTASCLPRPRRSRSARTSPQPARSPR